MQRDQMDVAIMDFSKAYVVVHHGRLLLKLAHYGITGTTHSWIKLFLVTVVNRLLKIGQLPP
ncbi:hypothetical protein DPMN_129738 [Dreissena polymorpha]|uniref:Uncharacterized protein n=1 Tax=Dreissena polymorpha TaxID=45954 RepID=A0A9D4JWY5_DREPO|nr:hypothetical protein DPMN_129738 [Dreissena polymorpha]